MVPTTASRTRPLLLSGAREVVTARGEGPARGATQGDAGILSGQAVLVVEGQIRAIGPRAALRASAPDAEEVDLEGGVVLPGLVDAHTHLLFAGDRADEWEARLGGASYLEILAAGGGIQRTVRATRAAPREALLQHGRRWALRALAHGTTTLEAKSGYGLERDTELRLLEVTGELARELPLRLVPTFLGAHVVPWELRGRRAEYLDLLERWQEEVAERRLARFADVFCEEEAFSVPEAERLLLHARSLGLGIKLHAEQFTASGAVALGVRLGATSVDHLEVLDDDGLDALRAATSPPVAVLLPGVPFHLGSDRHAPARRLIEAGVPVALATDFNPGSSFTPSLPAIVAIACRALRMTVAEAIVAVTRNAAHALGLGHAAGSLEVGRPADLVVLDVPDHRWLGYAFGWNPVRRVMVGGRWVAEPG